MKKILLLKLLALAGLVQAMDLSGKYLCDGYDTKDGAYTNDYVTLAKVSEHSYAEKDVYSYDFELKDSKGVLQYSGFASSRGSDLAIYFENVKNNKDKGVGIARADDSIIRDKDGKFKQSTTFTKFYFEPVYISDGSESCKKL
jgi:nitrous oxidase accessory protein NosD